MIEFLIIFLIALIVYILSELIRRKVLPENKIKEYQERLKELSKKLKETKDIKEQQKILQENSEILVEYLHYTTRYMIFSMMIFFSLVIPIFMIFKNKIIIPTPFKNPFTGKYGFGPVATYIICYLLISLVGNSIKKLKNKLRQT